MNYNKGWTFLSVSSYQQGIIGVDFGHYPKAAAMIRQPILLIELRCKMIIMGHKL
jgi:hypothetical protein